MPYGRSTLLLFYLRKLQREFFPSLVIANAETFEHVTYAWCCATFLKHFNILFLHNSSCTIIPMKDGEFVVLISKLGFGEWALQFLKNL